MCASEAQIAANRRNSTRSCGPRSVEGKRISRANSLKHGLCSAIVVPEDIELLEQRSREWYHTLRPQNMMQKWLCDKIAVTSVRIDRAERIERRLRDRRSLHAETAWGEDRRLAVARLARRIDQDSETVAEELRQTPEGCRWMIDRWDILANLAGPEGLWTDELIEHAFNLLGMPREFREGQPPGRRYDGQGKLVPGTDRPFGVARGEIQALEERLAHLRELDEVDRELTVADLLDENDPALRRNRRYEASLHNKLRWYLKKLEFQSPHIRPHPDIKAGYIGGEDMPIEDDAPGLVGPPPVPVPVSGPAPAPVPTPAAAPVEPEPEPGPPPTTPTPRPPIDPKSFSPCAPFDLEPHEFPPLGVAVNLPAIMAERRASKARKSEKDRDRRRRKVERLRA